jgi:hypothetical protein
MTRLDENSPDPWLPEKSKEEKLKEEIREEVVKELKSKKRKKALTCCALEFILVLLILSLLAAAIAKTGLVVIPGFSKIFYKTPSPQKIVSITPEEIKNFEVDLTQKLKNQVESQIQPGVAGQKIEVTLEFTEKELTAFLRALENQGTSPLKNSQISITQESIEIFGEIETPSKTFLTVAMKPDILNDKLKITLQKIKIGTLPIPLAFGNFIIDKFLNNQLRAAEESIGKAGKLESIILEDGKVVLRGLVDVLVFTQE